MVAIVEKKLASTLIKVLIAITSLLLVIIASILIPLAQYRQIFGISPLLLTIFILTGVMGCFLLFFSVMEIKEYVSYFRNLKDNVYRTHRLTYVQVMENESRKQLVESILESPGIHYNKLRKQCNLHPGQFRWHIDILLDYEIIRKQKIGYNLIFFPSISDQSEKIDIILRFPLREKIYELIVSNPGIISSEISRKLKIPNQRNKVKYHVDKLIQSNFVQTVQNGKKRELFPKRKTQNN